MRPAYSAVTDKVDCDSKWVCHPWCRLWRVVVPAHTLVEGQYPRWTFVIQLRRHGNKRLSRNTMNWRSVTGGLQQRTPATLPKLFPKYPVVCFLEVDKTCVDPCSIIPKFLKNLLESESVVCNTTARTKPHWVWSSFGSILFASIFLQGTSHTLFQWSWGERCFGS